MKINYFFRDITGNRNSQALRNSQSKQIKLQLAVQITMLCSQQQHVYHGQISLSMEICLPGREIIAMPYTNAHQWQQIDSIYLWVMPVLCTVLEEPQVSLMIVNVTRTIKLPVLKCRLDEARFFSGHKDSEFLPQDNDLQVLRAKVTFSLLCLRWKCGDRE